nr:tRNA (guanosine(37)-N1)-methyltransferase TrmD [Corynebacterium sp. LK24]
MRHALLGKAIEQGILSVGVHNLRDWASGVHQAVDDSPYGGGPGMVMKPDVWGPALDEIATLKVEQSLTSAVPHSDNVRHDQKLGLAEESSYAAAEVPSLSEEDSAKPLLIVPTPAGEPFTQQMAQEFSHEEHIVFACGRYEGIDQRVIDDAANRYRVREVSIGDYVLIGGEVAVLVIAESVVRLIPGVLGNRKSHEEDSFSDGLLEGPSYTKPREWRGLEVPDVLLSGNHALVDRWRRDQSLIRTAERRPDLLADVDLSVRDQEIIQEVIGEVTEENC